MATVPGRVRRRATLGDLKTGLGVRIRTKPPAQAQSYLDLWTLQRERARWAHTKRQADQMIQAIDKSLKELGLPEAAAAADGPDDPPAAKTIDFKPAAARRLDT
jgi:hypothetical protein